MSVHGLLFIVADPGVRIQWFRSADPKGLECGSQCLECRFQALSADPVVLECGSRSFGVRILRVMSGDLKVLSADLNNLSADFKI